MTAHARCPTCNQPWPARADQDAAIAVLVEQLADACRAQNHWISADFRVSEAAAAQLLNRSAGTLKNWRNGAAPLRVVRVRNRATYRLRDLAQFLIAGADNR